MGVNLNWGLKEDLTMLVTHPNLLFPECISSGHLFLVNIQDSLQGVKLILVICPNVSLCSFLHKHACVNINIWKHPCATFFVLKSLLVTWFSREAMRKFSSSFLIISSCLLFIAIMSSVIC